MINNNKKYFSLLCFLGSGSKLLQAQINNSKNIFTIPAYPLKFFPPLYSEWEIKNSVLTAKKVLDLIIKHHRSILDSRCLKGFNGLNNLGDDKKGFIKISEKKFKKNFLNFLDKKKINDKNVYLAIHNAYQLAINDQSKNIIFHPHDIEFFNSFILKRFETSKIIAITRSPIYNFWRRAYSDEKVEEGRFDVTDCEYIKNYRYINRLRDLYINFKNLNSKYLKICKFFTFEDLKTKNKKTLNKICKFINLKFDYKKMKNPTFDNKTWWGDKVYRGYKKQSDKSFISDSYSYEKELKSFSKYEIEILEIIMKPFMKKFNYNTYSNLSNNSVNYLKFFLLIFIPTKYGVKLFFSRLSIKKIFQYLKNTYRESFKKNILKNYYFNAMYKHKWSYKITYLIRFNLIRKLFYQNQNNLILKILYFITKILIYPFLQVELVILYFFRLYLLVYLFFCVRKKIQFIKKA